MSTQVTYNPMKFTCAPNQATPDYVIYDNFRDFVAYGLLRCWLGSDSDDPNSDCNYSRPITLEDVYEHRGDFLDTLESVIVGLWQGNLEPGEGWPDGEWASTTISTGDDDPDPTNLTWVPRLDKEALMLDQDVGSDPDAIWLSYEAIKDKDNVLKVLQEAREFAPGEVWTKLVEIVELEKAATSIEVGDVVKILARPFDFIDEPVGLIDPLPLGALCRVTSVSTTHELETFYTLEHSFSYRAAALQLMLKADGRFVGPKEPA